MNRQLLAFLLTLLYLRPLHKSPLRRCVVPHPVSLKMQRGYLRVRSDDGRTIEVSRFSRFHLIFLRDTTYVRSRIRLQNITCPAVLGGDPRT